LTRLSHPKSRPFEVIGSAQVAKAGPFALRTDVIRYPGGEEVPYHVAVGPDSVIVVPHFTNGDTMLVRQWRHAWDESSWEVPAGTLNEDEEPEQCARRELAEETGLRASRLIELGVIHGAAILTARAHLYLAEGITEAEQNLETYEQDMEVLRLPLDDALAAALKGEIVHSGSVTALARAAHKLKLI
jgi:8-oxo-dGTP pyrophosphatase MutT (NUDIX family)